MAIDYFLKIDGVAGESQDSKHKGEIDVQSWSWGESLDASGPVGPGKVRMNDLAITARLSKASPPLLTACASGQHFKTAELVGVAGKGDEVVRYRLSDVLVSSYHTAGSAADVSGPENVVSLTFAKLDASQAGGKGSPVTPDPNGGTVGPVIPRPPRDPIHGPGPPFFPPETGPGPPIPRPPLPRPPFPEGPT